MSDISVITEIQEVSREMQLTPSMQDFILHWGEMGTKWGVNRSVAQIHALLHISPKAPSDDVLVTILSSQAAHEHLHGKSITAPDKTTFPYFYDMRDDHPVGTFWYHPHMHGSVAAQVGPGSRNALLIAIQYMNQIASGSAQTGCVANVRRAQLNDEPALKARRCRRRGRCVLLRILGRLRTPC